MTDTVRYALPFGPLGALAHRALVRRDLERIFDYRARAVPRGSVDGERALHARRLVAGDRAVEL